MSKKIKKYSKFEFSFLMFIMIFFVAYAIMLIYPLLWGLISSLKTADEFYENTFGFFKIPQFSNYVRAIKEISDGGMTFTELTWNSLWFAGGSAIINVEFVSIYSYVLNKYKFKGRNFLYNLCLFMMAVPLGATLASSYRIYWGLGIANSYLILLSAGGVYSMNLIIFYSFYTNVSWSYAEAAKIDGANDYQVYFKAMRPQARAMLMTIGMLTFIEKWNDYMNPLLYLPDMPTLATGLFRYSSIVARSGNYPVLFAGLLMCLVPILLLFAFFSERLMGNISIGGLKG